jgi:hypothetical protein
MGDEYMKVPSTLVPLSVLALDLEPPPIGWTVYLAERGIAVVADDIGRSCISRSAARELVAERKAAQERAREVAEAREREAEAADRVWRASLPQGVAWYDMPPGARPAEAMLAAAHAARPRRRPTDAEWMFANPDEMTGGTFGPETAEAS